MVRRPGLMCKACDIAQKITAEVGFGEEAELNLAQCVVLGQLCVAPPLSPSTAGTDRRQHRGLPICRVIGATLPKRVPPPHHRLSARGNATTYTPSTRLLIHFTTGSPSSAPWESGGSAGWPNSINGRGKHTHHSSPTQDQSKTTLYQLLLLIT